MTVSTGDILQIVVNCRQPANDVAQLVFHSQYTDNPTLLDTEVVNDYQIFLGAMALAWAAGASLNHEWVDFVVRKQVAGGGFIEIGGDALGISGVALSDALPSYCAVLVTRRVTGSRGTAKKYFMGVTEGQQDQGILDPSALLIWAVVGGVWNDNPQDIPGTIGEYLWLCAPQGFGIANKIDFGGFVSPILSFQGRRKIGIGS